MDLGKEEDNFGQSDVPIAMSHTDKRIHLLQMDGLLTKEEIQDMLDQVEKGCDSLNEKQTDALKRYYARSADEKFEW